MKSQEGFSLIEILVSIAILGIAGVGFLSGLHTVYETIPLTEQENIALNLAENQMEYIRNQPYDPSGNYDIIPDLPPGYGIGIPMTGLMDPEDVGDGADYGLQRISVVVIYDDQPVTMLEACKADKS